MNQSKLPFVILGLLAQEPQSGYDLKKRIEVSVSNFIKASYGNIYPTLNRLSESNQIMVFDESKVHQKTRYQVTKKGLATLKKWLISPVSEEEVFLLRVYFFQFISKEARIKVMDDYETLLKRIRVRYTQIDDTFKMVMGKYPYETLMYGNEYIKNELKWLKALKRKEMV